MLNFRNNGSNLLRRYIPKERSWLIAIALLCTGILLSVTLTHIIVVAIHLSTSLKIYVSEWYDLLIFVPNPFWIYFQWQNDHLVVIQLVFVNLWFLFQLPFLIVWITHRFKKFVPEKA